MTNAIIAIICLVILLAVAIAYAASLASENADLKAKAGYDAETTRFLKSQVDKFDHDHDGKVGGSLRKGAPK